jgi:hypothetical protein
MLPREDYLKTSIDTIARFLYDAGINNVSCKALHEGESFSIELSNNDGSYINSFVINIDEDGTTTILESEDSALPIQTELNNFLESFRR